LKYVLIKIPQKVICMYFFGGLQNIFKNCWRVLLKIIWKG
jgi:hypothetical protein